MTTYLLDLIAGADSFASGSGHFVRLLDGGRLSIVAVDDAVISPHQRVRLVHPDVFRIHFQQKLRNVLPISKRSRCERLWEAATNTTVCLLCGHQPRSDFGVRRKTFTARRNYSGRPSSARNDEADGTKAPRRGNPAMRTVSHAAPLLMAKIEPRVLPQEHESTMLVGIIDYG